MRLPGGHNLALAAAALAVAGCSMAGDSLLGPPTCATPVISRSALEANATNVLSMYALANVHNADSVIVRFGVSAALDSATPSFSVTGDSVFAPVLGLRPLTDYTAQVTAFNHCGSASGDLLSLTTGSLPDDLPTYFAEGDAAPGYVVFAAGDYGVAIDNTGRVVWYHHFPRGPGLNFQAQPNGRYTARPPAATGEAPSWVEIAPDGSVTRTLECAHGLPPRMHDMIAQPDGSYWLLCDETRTVDLSAQGRSTQARVLGTDAQWRSATGEVLFEWSPFDHLAIDVSILDPVDLGPVINWTHGNAIDLDSDGNVLVSYRNLSEVMKIDVHRGAILWTMGGAGNDFAFDVHMPAFIHQHGVRAAGVGQLLLLDNLGEPASRAERYEYDPVTHFARLIDAHASLEGVTAQIGGSTQVLPGAHTLVSFGSGGAVEEYDADGQLVWRLKGTPGYIFRAQRVRSLYQPGVGDQR